MSEGYLRELFGQYQQVFGVGPGLGPGTGTSLLKVDGVTSAFIKAVFRVAAALYRSNPWKRFKPAHLFGVRVGKDPDWLDSKQPFCCAQFVGGGGSGDCGINLYRTDADAAGMTGIRGLGNMKAIPDKGLLRIAFGPEVELSSGNRKMIKTLGLEIAGLNAFPQIDIVYSPKGMADGFPSYRNPGLEELRWTYASLRALTQLHPVLQNVDGDASAFEAFLQTVDVPWPQDDPKAWENTVVRVSYPVKEEVEDTNNVVPKLAEQPESPVDLLEWSIPRQCVLCEKEVPGDKAPRCSRCKAVIYCGAVCQKKHWKELHKGNCELYQAMMEREEELEIKGFAFPTLIEHSCKWLESMGLHGRGMWRRMCSCFRGCPFGLLPPPEGGSVAGAWGVEHGKYPPDSPFLDFLGANDVSTMVVLSSWSEYYDLRALPTDTPVAALLSFPLSLYNIVTSLCVVTKNMLTKGRDVVVHYLGPEGELDWLPGFAEIGHLLGGAGGLHVYMVGPEVPSSLSGETAGVGRKLKVTFAQGLYQDEVSSLPPPNVVVALNSGLESYSTWIGALEVVKQQGVPAFFTDFAEPCCVNAKQALRASALQVTYPVTPNPFRSPCRNQIASSNVPWYSNGFVFGVNT
eukprot:TRINITY_DN902_c0_g1_i1.p1 TRINITY_DN902_c0_g1~~TRINITY_DN902_c0_g1_i1.p1  ORF type:complete len:628 (+),score=107.90 TRINITY_DN902_c0_g1_i1:335-2218(+)